MTQPPLDFTAPAVAPPVRSRTRKPSLTDKLEAYFRQHPGEWIPVTDMAAIVGTSGVRQRRLECEKRGLTLERKWWRDEWHRHHLAFRYVPKERAA